MNFLKTFFSGNHWDLHTLSTFSTTTIFAFPIRWLGPRCCFSRVPLYKVLNDGSHTPPSYPRWNCVPMGSSVGSLRLQIPNTNTLPFRTSCVSCDTRPTTWTNLELPMCPIIAGIRSRIPGIAVDRVAFDDLPLTIFRRQSARRPKQKGSTVRLPRWHALATKSTRTGSTPALSQALISP